MAELCLHGGPRSGTPGPRKSLAAGGGGQFDQNRIDYNRVQATLKGDGGLYRPALWTRDGYACSLRLSSGPELAGWSGLLSQIS